MNEKLLVLCTAITLILASGCAKDEPAAPNHPQMSGSWFGGASGIRILVTLSERENVINGTGKFITNDTLSVSVAGSKVYPDITLQIAAAGYQPALFRGKFSDDNTVMGKFNGSGFSNFDMVFRRQ
jgi:hypothetical protein